MVAATSNQQPDPAGEHRAALRGRAAGQSRMRRARQIQQLQTLPAGQRLAAGCERVVEGGLARDVDGGYGLNPTIRSTEAQPPLLPGAAAGAGRGDCRTFPGALERLFAFVVTVGAYMQAGLVARGLTRARATVIWQLHRQGPVTQRQLAQTIGVTARNVTALVDGLEKAGFVQRDRHPGDRRALLVRLTTAGRAVTAQLAADYEAGAARLFAGLPADQVEQFLAMLDVLTVRLAPVATDEPDR